jgi:hypothetical protein
VKQGWFVCLGLLVLVLRKTRLKCGCVCSLSMVHVVCLPHFWVVLGLLVLLVSFIAWACGLKCVTLGWPAVLGLLARLLGCAWAAASNHLAVPGSSWR